jgi:hypothetical protein
LADIQMKRLNGMLAVLSDPREREKYDLRLAGFDEPEYSQRRQLTVPPPRWLWPAVTMMAMTVMVPFALWMTKPAGGAPTPAPPVVQATPPDILPARRPPAHNIAPDALPPIRIREPKTRQDSEPTAIAGPTAGGEPAEGELATPLPIMARADPADQPGAADQRPGLAGEWFFVSTQRNSRSVLYPPEYIELRVTEEEGLVRGRYYARYHVMDKAISPTVAFQFQGRVDPDGGRVPWSGTGGARGEVTLRLLASGSLEVTWVAQELGRDLALISGTATLVRRIE